MQAVEIYVVRATLAAAAFLLAAPATAHQTYNLAQLDRPSGVFDGGINDYLVDPASATVRTISDAYGSAATFGYASYGALKASATATGGASGFGRFSARSGAGFDDDLTFSSDGLDGTAGIFTATILFERTLNQTGTAVDGNAVDSLHLGTASFAYDYQEILQLSPSGCVPGTGSPCALALRQQTINGGDAATWLDEDTLSIRVPFTFGASTELSLTLDVAALATFYEGSSNWTADAAHSLYWGGISSVTDAAGSVVDFSLGSASGTDYTRSFAPLSSVPENSSSLLMLSALGAGLAAALRRRWSPGPSA